MINHLALSTEVLNLLKQIIEKYRSSQLPVTKYVGSINRFEIYLLCLNQFKRIGKDWTRIFVSFRVNHSAQFLLLKLRVIRLNSILFCLVIRILWKWGYYWKAQASINLCQFALTWMQTSKIIFLISLRLLNKTNELFRQH